MDRPNRISNKIKKTEMIKIEIRPDCLELRQKFPTSNFTDLYSNHLIGVTENCNPTYDGEKIMDDLMSKQNYSNDEDFISKYVEMEGRLEKYFKLINEPNLSESLLIFMSDYTYQGLTIADKEILELS